MTKLLSIILNRMVFSYWNWCFAVGVCYTNNYRQEGSILHIYLGIRCYSIWITKTKLK